MYRVTTQLDDNPPKVVEVKGYLAAEKIARSFWAGLVSNEVVFESARVWVERIK